MWLTSLTKGEFQHKFDILLEKQLIASPEQPSLRLVQSDRTNVALHQLNSSSVPTGRIWWWYWRHWMAIMQ